MSKKVIGPTLPPHLQHLVVSTSECPTDRHDGSASPACPSNACLPDKSTDDDEDDGVLVLHASDDEALVSSTERPKPAVKLVSRSSLDSSDDESSFGPGLPSTVEKSSRGTGCKSSDDEASFGPALPPNFKKSSRDAGRKSDDGATSFGPALPPIFKKDSRPSRSTPNSSDDEASFGPTLPPNFKLDSRPSRSTPDSYEDEALFEPALELDSRPSRSTPDSSGDEPSFGPSLPPRFKQDLRPSQSTLDSSGDEPSFGPSLPPSFPPKSRNSLDRLMPTSSNDRSSYGPSLPPNFKRTADDQGSVGQSSVIGPIPPPGIRASPGADSDCRSESDDDVVGPMPPGNDSTADQNHIQRQLEARALKMKRKLAGEDEDTTSRAQARDSWMLELPPDRAGEFGLGPRQFRARARQDLGDRSVWTDTPDDKERKANHPEQVEATSTSSLKSETEMLALAQRDREMQKQADKHNKKKKRKESLVNMHQEKLKKKRKKEEVKGKPKERRPFDRNVDLQANRFDEAQKKAILRKAQLLDDRFSRGETKFL